MKTNSLNRVLILLLSTLLFAFNFSGLEVKAINKENTPKGIVINVTDYGADPSGKEDNAIAIWNALEAAKEISKDGEIPVTLNFPKGEYHIYKDYAQTREYHTSNTNSIENPIKHIGILIENQKNLTIEGNDSMFVMHGNIMALAIVKSENIKLNNFSWEYGVATTSEMTVLNMGEIAGKQYTDYYIPSSYPHEIDGRNLKWLSEKSPYTGEYYWQQKNDHGAWAYVGYNPTTKTSRRYQGNSPFNKAEKLESIDENTVRITFNSSGRPQKELLGFVYEFCATPWRETAGAFIWESVDTVIDSVNVHYMHGFGWLTQMSENVSFINCDFLPREGSGRLTTSYADLIHISGAKGTINIENCNFGHAHDDPINIHGTFTRVEEKLSSTKLKLKYIENQQGGFQQYYIGDEVVFAARDGLTPLNGKEEIFTVIDVINPFEDGLDGKNMIITFDKKLPDNITDKIGSEPKYVAENITYTPTVNIKNNTFQTIPTRGILCSTRKPVVIENNIFKNMTMQTIFLSNDSNAWYESGPITDMTIRNNTFHITNSDSIEGNNSDNQSAIHIHPEVKNGLPSNQTPVHKNITIDGNTFYMEKAKVVEAESVENLVITNNKVIRNNPNIDINITSDKTDLNIGEEVTIDTVSTGKQVNNDVISLTKCNDVTIAGNTFDDGLKLNIRNNDSINIKNMQPELTINGTNLTAPTSDIQYASTNPAVATINNNGTITALKSGTTEIFAYYNWNNTLLKSNYLSLVINDDNTAIKPTEFSISNDDNLMLTDIDSTINFNVVTNAESINGSVIWSVLDAKTGTATTAATIDENGVLTAKSKGIVEVKATLNGVSDSKTVILSLPTLGSSLSNRFTVTNEDSAKWKPDVNSNGLTITMQPGDIYGTYNNGGQGVKNLFLFEDFNSVPKDDLFASVEIDNLPIKSGQSLTASFLLYKDNDNYLTVGKKGHFNGITSVNEINGVATETGGISSDNNVTSATFAFYKLDDKVTAYYKPADGNWTELNSSNLNNNSLNEDYKIGFAIWGPNGHNDEITFKNFKMAKGSETKIDDSENLPSIPFMSNNTNNNAPIITNSELNKSEYKIGETASIDFDYSDIDNDAIGETLYRWKYTDDFGNIQSIYSTENNFRIISGQEIECTIYASDIQGKLSEPTTVKANVKAPKSYKLSSLTLNGLNLDVDDNSNDYTINLPNDVNKISLSYVSINSTLGKVKVLKNGDLLNIDKLSTLNEFIDVSNGDIIEIQRLTENNNLKEKYTINIIKMKSTDAYLTSIFIPELDFSETDINKNSYSLTVDDINLFNAELNLKSNSSATETKVYRGQGRIPVENKSTEINTFSTTLDIRSGVNSYYIEVISEDTNYSKEYMIHLISKGNPDASLESIKLDNELIEEFTSDNYEYDVNLDGLLEKAININVKPTNPMSTVSFTTNGVLTEGNSIDIKDLNKGINKIIITVKAPNTVSVNHYVVNIIIPNAENSNIRNISLEGAALTPMFDPNITKYETNVSIDNITISALTEESNGKLTISYGSQKIEGIKEINTNLKLYKGNNLIKVTSISPNGNSSKEYIISVNVSDTVYLSDLPIESEPVISANAPAKLDKAISGNPLKLKDPAGNIITYEKGVGVQATSKLIYNIASLGFTNLTGVIGIDNFQSTVSNSPASVRFKIYLDDSSTPVFDSVDEMLVNTPSKNFNIDVTNAKKVKFVAEAGSTTWNDHANWADVKFINGNISIKNPIDINNDGILNIGDLSIVSKFYGYNNTDDSDVWDSIKSYDLNNDCIINEFEIELISNELINLPSSL